MARMDKWKVLGRYQKALDREINQMVRRLSTKYRQYSPDDIIKIIDEVLWELDISTAEGFRLLRFKVEDFLRKRLGKQGLRG